jgi:ATP-dependent protease ClpP protease subunit
MECYKDTKLTSNMMLKDTYLTAQQALELGLISEII